MTDNEKRFRQLIAENPDLRIVPMVSNDFNYDPCIRWEGEFGYSRIAKIYERYEGTFFKNYHIYESDEIDELVEAEVDDYCTQHECEPNDELFEIIRKNVERYNWENVIIVNIDPMRTEEET